MAKVNQEVSVKMFIHVHYVCSFM